MNTVESLLKLDINDLTPEKKTFDIKIERISKLLHRKGIEEDFIIKVESIDADTLYDYDSAIIDFENDKFKMDKKAMYKKGLELCNLGIIDPKFNDPQLLSFLDIKMKQPIPEVVWNKLFLKSEIVSIGQQIAEFSRNILNGDEYTESLTKERKKIKNS